MNIPLKVMQSFPLIIRCKLPLIKMFDALMRREKNEFRIIVTSPDYQRLGFGSFIIWEKGEKTEVILQASEPFQDAFINGLLESKLKIK